jgi:hypothetical protein
MLMCPRELWVRIHGDGDEERILPKMGTYMGMKIILDGGKGSEEALSAQSLSLYGKHMVIGL